MSKKRWKHIGGGCMIVGDLPYPCDDEYENTETGARASVYSTTDVHFRLPLHVDSLEELRPYGVMFGNPYTSPN